MRPERANKFWVVKYTHPQWRPEGEITVVKYDHEGCFFYRIGEEVEGNAEGECYEFLREFDPAALAFPVLQTSLAEVDHGYVPPRKEIERRDHAVLRVSDLRQILASVPEHFQIMLESYESDDDVGSVAVNPTAKTVTVCSHLAEWQRS